MVIIVISWTLLSPAECWSLVSAAGPVTYAVIPSGGVLLATMSRTAATDSFAMLSPWFPRRYSWT